MASLTPSDVKSMVSLRVDNPPYHFYGKDVKTSFKYLKTYVNSTYVNAHKDLIVSDYWRKGSEV